MSGSEGENTERCIAITTSGSRCTRDATDGRFCYQHDESNETIDFEAAEQSSPVDEPSASESSDDHEPDAVDLPRDGQRPAVDAGAEETDVTDDLRTKATDVTEDVRNAIGEYGPDGDEDLKATLKQHGETAKEVGTDRARTAMTIASAKASPVIESIRDGFDRLRSRISKRPPQTEHDSARE